MKRFHSLKNYDALEGNISGGTFHNLIRSFNIVLSYFNTYNALSLATKYILTIPSAFLSEFNTLIQPTSLVLSQWVPQQASTSTPSILTTLKVLPGITPP